MGTLNYLCGNDVSDEDCYKCLIHGIQFSCPPDCPDFADVRARMSPEMLEFRQTLMDKLGVKDER